jgi:predicted RNA-binding protein YlqC (UPF0109 family)
MSTNISPDASYVANIVYGLVTKPDDITIKRELDERGVLLRLTVAPEDLGRVIGKHGSNAQSIRTLLRAFGSKNDAIIHIKFNDNREEYSHE